ncbi:MAG: amidase, partial [Hyphomicrobiales bacterium]|nr:amidase [Hyphomicrobiales bacterium]
MSQPTDLHFRSAVQLAGMLRNREISSVELLDHFLARKDKYNPSLNAIIVCEAERAREAARKVDKRLAKGETVGPLDGLPMTIKESFNWTGTPTTWGVPKFKDNIAGSDACAVDRLQAAGAIVYGKTNVPFMLSDWQSFNDIYGTTNNPWDLSKVPGGSSGGSAAALAAGMTGLDIGSDIGSSIRNPAHYCGVYGHKPTYSLVPYTGHSLPGIVVQSDITVAGPLARSAQDLRLAMKILAGPDGVAARGMKFKLPKSRAKRLKDFRVAVVLESEVAEVDDSVKELIAKLTRFLEPKVKTLSMTAKPDFDDREAHDTYIALLRAATSRSQTDDEFMANRAIAEALPADDHSYYANMVRGFTMSQRDWLTYDNRRHQLRQVWDSFFADYDVLLCPTASTAAFPHDQEGERHERTIIVNGKQVPVTDQM